MKTKSVSAAIAFASLFLTFTAAAQGNGNSVRKEKSEAKFVLIATPFAPEGAKGNATFKSESTDGVQTATLQLQTQGLDPGDYTVSAVQISDGVTVALAQFTVPESEHKTKSKDKMIIVADVDGADVGELIVSDTNEVAMLTGELGAQGSKGTLNATVPITPGDAAPEATGFAKLKVSVKNGKRKDHFIMKASGVPPNSTFTVNVDGTDVGEVKSRGNGQVLVKSLPAELTSIGFVLLVDSDGSSVVLAEF